MSGLEDEKELGDVVLAFERGEKGVTRRPRRLSAYFYWRDLWVGAYPAPDGMLYVCLIPTIVIRWRRR